ncbi:735_t:CDS:1 [Cetraspora pellucida]|uniref:735_t:CDS:1 n=1 Tax=Cetraspora pellucida TaxID=1433469 RepID=A0A9N9NT68_9GLOM|nr:735_t:CDS:1 [Cetraspora pellucida]
MKNDSGVQEVSSSLMMTGNILEDKVKKNQEMNIRNSLDRLMIDIVKIVYREKSLSERENKKKLVKKLADRILSKTKDKNRIVNSIQDKNIREEKMDFDIEERLYNNIARNRLLDNVYRDSTGLKMLGMQDISATWISTSSI